MHPGVIENISMLICSKTLALVLGRWKITVISTVSIDKPTIDIPTTFYLNRAIRNKVLFKA